MKMRVTDGKRGLEFKADETAFEEKVIDALLDFWRGEFHAFQTRKIGSHMRYVGLELHILAGDVWWQLRSESGGFPQVTVLTLPPWGWVEHTMKNVKTFQRFMETLKTDLGGIIRETRPFHLS